MTSTCLNQRSVNAPSAPAARALNNDRCKLHEVGIPRGIPRIPLGEQTNVRFLTSMIVEFLLGPVRFLEIPPGFLGFCEIPGDTAAAAGEIPARDS